MHTHRLGWCARHWRGLCRSKLIRSAYMKICLVRCPSVVCLRCVFPLCVLAWSRLTICIRSSWCTESDLKNAWWCMPLLPTLGGMEEWEVELMLLKLIAASAQHIWATHINAYNSDILSLDMLGARQREKQKKGNDIKVKEWCSSQGYGMNTSMKFTSTLCKQSPSIALSFNVVWASGGHLYYFPKDKKKQCLVQLYYFPKNKKKQCL